MSQLNEYKVTPVTTDAVRPWLLELHYLKRMTSMSYKFGLIHNNEVMGVVTYGNAIPYTMAKSPFGDKWHRNVQELNRLVLSPKCPKNAASFLVSRSIKQLPKPTIVVSYADAGKGHVGYIYQAANFIYTGKSHTQKDWVLKSRPDIHTRTLMDEFAFTPNRIELLKDRYGDDLVQVDRPAKNRYVYVHADKRTKAAIMKDAQFKSHPYPKGNSARLATNATINTQGILF